MEPFSTDIRRSAVEKLLSLSLKTSSRDGNSTNARLSERSSRPGGSRDGIIDHILKFLAPTSRQPMGIRELDVLLALCKASPSVNQLEHASRLVAQLSPYLRESHSQLFQPSPFLHTIRPSPWESLTYSLTLTLLSLSLKFPQLHEQARGAIDEYLRNCTKAVNTITVSRDRGDGTDEYDGLRSSLGILSIAVSLVGFLEASAVHIHFWTASEKVRVVEDLRTLFSEEFMVAIETASSTVRSLGNSDAMLKDWKKYARRYAAHGRPLGAMLMQQGYMRFVMACTASLVVGSQYLSEDELLDEYMKGVGIARGNNADLALVVQVTNIINDRMHSLDDGSDYLQLGSQWQQSLAFSVKSYCLIAFLNCALLDSETADRDVLSSWLEDTLSDPVQMACAQLAKTTLKSVAIISRMAPSSASSSSRALMRFIVQGTSSTGSIIAVAAQSLAQILTVLSQDAVITTLYSIGNVLSPGTGHEGYVQDANGQASYSGSVVSFSIVGEGDNITHSNAVHAVVTIATSSNDEKINALAQSMLLQKIGKVNAMVDACIIRETAVLALSSGQTEFRLLLKFYHRLQRGERASSDRTISEAIHDAMVFLSMKMEKRSPLYGIYLTYLLENIINKGDAINFGNNPQQEVAFTPDDISPLLKPLAFLLYSGTDPDPDTIKSAIDLYEEDMSSMFRDAWFNIAVHGISINSNFARTHFQDLRLIAAYSPPLVAEDRIGLLESDVELNIILRRGMNPQRAAEQKKILFAELPSRESDIKRLDYAKAVFLNAALLVETLRASAGDCTKVLNYFSDPALASSEMANTMSGVAEKVVGYYLSITLSGKHEQFSIAYLSKQLAEFFAGSCHRIERVQKVAILCATKIINQCPFALCERSSLFCLLELLTVMWTSCLEGELDEFDWKSSFVSFRDVVKLELPDNYSFRKRTLDSILQRARVWVPAVISIAPLDVKSLLQTYLSTQDDNGAYGHVCLGRSFALEMGSLIPRSDQRLGSIESCDDDIVNLASDFMAQYTTRQKCRFVDFPSFNGFVHDTFTSTKPASKVSSFAEAVHNIENIFSSLHQQGRSGENVPVSLFRDAMRRAAALLCCSGQIYPRIMHDLVTLPFQSFTVESIQLGVSIWLGVIYDNPSTEPRILIEVVEAWEQTIQRRTGLFDPSLEYVDPMFTKIEHLPTDKAHMLQQRRRVHDCLAPHFHLLRFLESHFSAIHLANAQNQRLFYRLIGRTIEELTRTTAHPVAREIHFRLVLFGLKILRHSTLLSKTASWKLKDKIISAGLSWFKHAPRWPFGGNRIEAKAEDKVFGEVGAALHAVAGITPHSPGLGKLLQAKQDLLLLLLENERSRLSVWLSPLEHGHKHNAVLARGKQFSEEASSLLWVAWTESPGLAIQLAMRTSSAKLNSDIRGFLLKSPDKALNEPAALEILFDSSLPADVSSQLKYLLYWAPVNPMEALTYFLPAYGNHPFVLQYAMRALESHTMDVRFYIVPQLVQALRYDALGYVHRYIFETAKLSQLFAHQVIWNMKANSYKDEDSQIPDPLKPTLDSFMENLISSFTDEERGFYEREFSFFGEITGISGKLRPYIKKSKAEKKEKIEQELRQIKLEVGVYLPSNPDGVVVGIDRKSGKPLQSHAKAPYMATFRIQKTGIQHEDGSEDPKLNRAVSKTRPGLIGPSSSESESALGTYEVWQSAIFKVGDDCRQDMLALQLIAAFRSIFASVGLDVWVFPYRVTSTAPGCGVIDVLPNSISRDMLGREAVNGLYDYFVSKYGGEDSIRFQEARTNFVKSMAAYSVISYLLQFKDRHNGNIMIDDAGHIVHIDFGFCFDIAPGGVRFERAPFKLTSEMVSVMSGISHAHHHLPGSGSSFSDNPVNTQPYRWFESLVVKAFLASRPYSNKLSHIVSLMVDSGLPCFKPDTLKNLRDRFVLDKSERDAADYMRELTRKSYMSFSTKGYDQFQLITNGIPY